MGAVYIAAARLGFAALLVSCHDDTTDPCPEIRHSFAGAVIERLEIRASISTVPQCGATDDEDAGG